MHNNRKYCTHSLFFSKKTISHSKTIETNLSLSLRNEPLIPINSNTLLRTYRSRYLSLPLHIRIFTHQPRTCPLTSPYQHANRCAHSHSFIPAFALFFTERATPCLCTFACHLTHATPHGSALTHQLFPLRTYLSQSELIREKPIPSD